MPADFKQDALLLPDGTGKLVFHPAEQTPTIGTAEVAGTDTFSCRKCSAEPVRWHPEQALHETKPLIDGLFENE